MIVQFLTEWCSRSEDAPLEPARFITSLNHIKDVYRYLESDLSPKKLQDLLHDYNAIFYPPFEAVAHPHVLYEGKFLGIFFYYLPFLSPPEQAVYV